MSTFNNNKIMPLVYKIKSVISLPLRASTVDIHTISITANKNCGNEHNLLYIYIQCQSSIHQAVYVISNSNERRFFINCWTKIKRLPFLAIILWRCTYVLSVTKMQLYFIYYSHDYTSYWQAWLYNVWTMNSKISNTPVKVSKLFICNK